MILFLQPVWLWCLLPVAAVAAWALYRPGRQLAVVGSLALWQEALERMDRSRRLRSRRITASWVLLLAGAAAAVVAAGGPTYTASRPARSVALVVHPSAEVASPEGLASLRRAAEAVLNRLNSTDRVRLILPEGGMDGSRWLTPAEAKAALGRIEPVPVPARRLSLPAPSDVQHVYRVAPAGAEILTGPDETLIEVPTSLPDATLDALGAAPLEDGNVQVFFALRNQSAQPWRGNAFLATEADGNTVLVGQDRANLPSPGGRDGHVKIAPPCRWLFVSVEPAGGTPAARKGETPSPRPEGFLVRREAVAARVALIGADDPLVRRFIKVNPELRMVGAPAEADVVICIGVHPPPGKPALVIRPPIPPAGAPSAGRAENLALGDPAITTDAQDPLLHDVDLSAVAVRAAEPWTVPPASPLKALCSYNGRALILRTAGDETPDAAGEPRRVYVAFAFDTENTNFGMTESFVVFLANAMRWLAPQSLAAARYDCVSPLEAGPQVDWTRVAGDAPFGRRPLSEGGYPWPGVYLDSRGGLHAVTLVGLRSASPAVPPDRAAAEAPLPAPRMSATSRGLGVWLALAAVLLWLAGWAARTR